MKGTLSPLQIAGRLVTGLIAILSPLIWIMFATTRALYSGYNETYLTDPGHKRIKIYDQLVVLLSIVLTGAAIAYSFDFSMELFAQWLQQAHSLIKFFTLQFSGRGSYIVLQVLSISLYVYDQGRATLIRRINESQGAW